jgi:hypothetical protein
VPGETRESKLVTSCMPTRPRFCAGKTCCLQLSVHATSCVRYMYGPAGGTGRAFTKQGEKTCVARVANAHTRHIMNTQQYIETCNIVAQSLSDTHGPGR